MISHHQSRHRLNDWHGAGYHTGVMASFAGYFGCIAVTVNGLLGVHDSGHWFKSDFKIDRHAIADTALYTA